METPYNGVYGVLFIYKTQVMKTILTITFVLFITMAAQAQDAKIEANEVKVEMTDAKEIKLENTTEVARLYKFKNSRVKKALAFTTKRNKAKMA